MFLVEYGNWALKFSMVYGCAHCGTHLPTEYCNISALFHTSYLAPYIVTSLPAVLFSGGSAMVVEGSVIWLYCEANSLNVTATWNKDNIEILEDEPRVFTKTYPDLDSTTFLLGMSDVQLSNTGTYQCFVHDELDIAIVPGEMLTLTGKFPLPST